MAKRDFYDILGVPKNAADDDINDGSRRLSALTASSPIHNVKVVASIKSTSPA